MKPSWTGSRLYSTGELSITAAPEPESWALLLARLGAVGYLPRRPQSARMDRG